METVDLYFCSLAAWLYHPGYQKEGTKKPTLDEIADTVDAMLKIRSIRWP